MSAGLVPLYLRAVTAGMDHFLKVFPRVSGFPFLRISCNSSQTALIELRWRTLSIETALASFVDICQAATTVKFLPSGARPISCITSGFLASCQEQFECCRV